MDFKINADIEGRTLEEFAKLVEARKKYLNETTEQSIAACSINFLKSIRAQTKIAKPTKPFNIEVVQQANLCLGFRSMGKGKGTKKIPCLRVRGSNARFDVGNDGTLVIATEGLQAKNALIFLWVRRSGRKYYIAAPSESGALRWLKKVEKKRIKKYRGLAKHALGRLAHKVSATTNVSDNIELAA